MPSVSINSVNPAEVGTALLVVALVENPTLARNRAELDSATEGALTRMIEMKDFRGARDEMLHLTGVAKGPRRLLLVGMGAVTDRKAAFRRAATLAGRNAQRLGVGEMVWYSGQISTRRDRSHRRGLDRRLVGVLGSQDRSCRKRSARNRSRKPSSSPSNTDDSRRGLAHGQAIGAGQSLARRLGDDARKSLHAGISGADRDRDRASGTGWESRCSVGARWKSEKMGSFLASRRERRRIRS